MTVKYIYLLSALFGLLLPMAVRAQNVSNTGAYPQYASPYVFHKNTATDIGYAYNSNGSMTRNPDRHIGLIEYDCFNNPRLIQFTDGSATEYVYDASGTKLKTVHRTAVPGIEVPYGTVYEHTASTVLSSDSTLYAGPFVLSGDSLRYKYDGGSVLIPLDGSPVKPCFYALDHLGSVRLVVSADGQVMERSDYYPSGCMITGNITNEGNIQPYKYNGKELDPMHGLYTYDYGARQYDPATTLWDRMDPLCEENPEVSPYVYCHNNPVNRIDYKGLYDFENICGYTDYPVIAVFQSNRDKTLEYDYQIAKEMGMPIFVVDNIGDFKDALDDLALKGSTFQTIALNSHGSYGKFNIGDDTIDMTTDLSSLREKLEGRTVFVGACNVGDSYGCFMVEGLAEQTSSTVVAACHKISAGYRYDGGDGLNYYEGEFPYIMLPSVLKGNKYILSESGSESKSVRNVTIDKRAGISWEGYYFDNYGIFNNKFRWAY